MWNITHFNILGNARTCLFKALSIFHVTITASSPTDSKFDATWDTGELIYYNDLTKRDC